MKYHIETEYNKNTYKRFAVMTCATMGIKRIAGTILSGIVVAVLGLFLGNQYPSSSMPILVFGLGCVIVLYAIGYPQRITRNMVKYCGEKTKSNFAFNDDNFLVTDSNGTHENEYSAVTKLIETKEFLYVYLNESQCYILEKKNITENVEELKLFIETNTALKFKKLNAVK